LGGIGEVSAISKREQGGSPAAQDIIKPSTGHGTHVLKVAFVKLVQILYMDLYVDEIVIGLKCIVVFKIVR
jgi:hypothetical protein